MRRELYKSALANAGHVFDPLRAVIKIRCLQRLLRDEELAEAAAGRGPLTREFIPVTA